MSITKEITIFCDGCTNWQAGSQVNVTAAIVRRECKRFGWVRCGRKDYCPTCSNRTLTPAPRAGKKGKKP